MEVLRPSPFPPDEKTKWGWITLTAQRIKTARVKLYHQIPTSAYVFTSIKNLDIIRGYLGAKMQLKTPNLHKPCQDQIDSLKTAINAQNTKILDMYGKIQAIVDEFSKITTAFSSAMEGQGITGNDLPTPN